MTFWAWFWIVAATYLAIGAIYAGWTVGKYADEGAIDRRDGVSMFVYVTVFWPRVMWEAVADYIKRDE